MENSSRRILGYNHNVLEDYLKVREKSNIAVIQYLCPMSRTYNINLIYEIINIFAKLQGGLIVRKPDLDPKNYNDEFEIVFPSDINKTHFDKEISRYLESRVRDRLVYVC